jgi:hypothetical protein
MGGVWVLKNGLYNLGKEKTIKNTYHQIMNSTNIHFFLRDASLDVFSNSTATLFVYLVCFHHHMHF